MRVLLISTWFPYPPVHGAKTRAYHLMHALARRHEVALVSFEDTPVLPAWREKVEALCGRVEIVSRSPFAHSRLGRLRGWFSAEPSAVVAGYSPEMAAAVRTVASGWQPDCVVALTFVAAPYALKVANARRVLDVDNLTAEMLREDAQHTRMPLQRWRRELAARKFARYERKLCQSFDLSLVTSARDAVRLQHGALLPEGRIAVVSNGVDLEQLQPGLSPVTPNRLVFNGSVTYEPNLDAVGFFLHDIFPAVQAEVPEATLMVTGSTDGVAIAPLAANRGVQFTGFVEDIRPLVGGSTACVVPLRRGGGTRLKILEAMALGTPVVSTAKGAEGLELVAGRELMVEDTPAGFALATLRLLRDPALRRDLAARAHQKVSSRYGWEQIGEAFLNELEAIGYGRPGVR